MGHEFCGTVLDLGPSTDGPAPGTVVTSVPIMVTATGIQDLAYTNLQPCGYSERMLLSALLTLEVPNGLAPTHAALTEPMAVGLHAVNRSGLQAGDGAVVVGCGPVGLAVIAALKLLGVAPIVAADFSPARRALAATMGAHEVVDPATETPFQAWTRVGGGKQMAVFEAVGVPGHDRRAAARRAGAEPHRRSSGCACSRTRSRRSTGSARSSTCSSSSATRPRSSPPACTRSPRVPSTWPR